MVIMSFIESIVNKFRFDETGFFLDAHEEIEKRIKELKEQEESTKKREEQVKNIMRMNYEYGKLSSREEFLNSPINKDMRCKNMGLTREEEIFEYLRMGLIEEDEATRLLRERWKENTRRKEKTNQFNNQFILQSNASDHKSSYQCVVCGSFNVDKENYYRNDWNIVKKTITCGDCGNKFKKEND